MDLEVLELVRHLPARYRLDKLLERKTLAAERLRLNRLPVVRHIEAVDYHEVLGSVERACGQVSAFVLKDNPIFEEFFDAGKVSAMIRQVAESPPSPGQRGLVMRVVDSLPHRWRTRLVAQARYRLGMSSRYMTSPWAVLLRIV